MISFFRTYNAKEHYDSPKKAESKEEFPNFYSLDAFAF